MQYFDKNGAPIKAGMTIRMEDDSLELVYDTTDSYGNPDLGINASKGNRKVSYANKSNLEDTIVMLYSTQSVGEKMTEEERATHRPGPDRRNRTDMAFSPRKPGRKPKAETDDDDDAEKGDSMPMSQSNIPAGEETEIIINEKGDIVDERIRNDLPR